MLSDSTHGPESRLQPQPSPPGSSELTFHSQNWPPRTFRWTLRAGMAAHAGAVRDVIQCHCPLHRPPPCGDLKADLRGKVESGGLMHARSHPAPQGGPTYLELPGALHRHHGALPAPAAVPRHAPHRALPRRAVQCHPQLPAGCKDGAQASWHHQLPRAHKRHRALPALPSPTGMAAPSGNGPSPRPSWS